MSATSQGFTLSISGMMRSHSALVHGERKSCPTLGTRECSDAFSRASSVTGKPRAYGKHYSFLVILTWSVMNAVKTVRDLILLSVNRKERFPQEIDPKFKPFYI